MAENYFLLGNGKQKTYVKIVHLGFLLQENKLSDFVQF